MAKIDELEQQVEMYEQLLEKAFAEPRKAGVIAAGPDEEGFYRVDLEEGQHKFVIPVEKAQKGNSPKKWVIGQKVMVTDKIIIKEMPEVLEVKPKPVEFNKIGWSEIGGMSSQIETIRDAVEMPLKNPELYKKFGVKPTKGILLWGPSGCGKTIVAKAIASTILSTIKQVEHDSFVYVKGAELLSSLVGQAEAKIRKLFNDARSHYKRTGIRATIFIDEAEAILPARGSRKSSDVETTIVPTFLAEMDGFEDGNPFMILATNLPENMDGAVLREGRIDLKIQIGRPTVDDAIEIFLIHLNKTKVRGCVETVAKEGAIYLYKHLGETDRKTSGAQIAAIVHKSAYIAIKRVVLNKNSDIGVTYDDVETAINQLVK